MFKVALVGTVCTGKTTVINYLKRGIYSFPVVFLGSIAGEYITMHHPENIYSHAVNLGIQDLIVQKEAEAESRGEVVVCHRSVICPAIYDYIHGDLEGYAELIKRAKTYLSSYDVFMLFDPTEVPYIATDFRHEDDLLRTRLHEAYLKVLQELCLPWQLVTGPEVERINAIKTLIEGRHIFLERGY